MVKGKSETLPEIPRVSGIPEIFQIGLVLGASGSGKTRLVKSLFGSPEEVQKPKLSFMYQPSNLCTMQVDWTHNKAVVSHFPCPKTLELNTKGAADEGIDR
jgi:hypothetical protein